MSTEIDYGRIDLRIPIDMYEKIKLVAEKHGEPENKRTGQVQMTRTILFLLEEALQKYSNKFGELDSIEALTDYMLSDIKGTIKANIASILEEVHVKP